MRRARIVYLGVAALLLVAGASFLAGCGGKTASSGDGGAVSGLQPFVAYATVAPGGNEGTSTVVGEVTQWRDATALYKVEGSDQRVSGSFTVTYNVDTTADGNSKLWGNWVLTNDKGTWVCDGWSGAQDAKGETYTFGISKGTGDYEGLITCWQWHWPLDNASFTVKLPLIAVSGWIQTEK
jgi:hypothetical protein